MESTLGEIITFYSYKGGTGRSMALANVACLFAQRQNVSGDVLMIDWDLEAPGLHQFFHGRFDNIREEQGDLPSGQLGLIDLFYEIRTRLEKSKSQDNIPDDVFSEIDIQKYIIKVNRPLLFLMPAGKFDDGSYSARVNEFDWPDFFNNFPSVITQFAQHLRKKYKYVLIDSRTGYTDISGICTSIMPEKLVAVFTPNRQSLSGIVELIRRATNYRKQSDDLRPLMIFPLPSRIENAEGELQKEWRFGNSKHEGYQTQLASVLMDVYGLQECDLTNYFDEYQLQYVPKYSYGEELAVLSERSEYRLSLARSFENFAERIVGTKNPWEEIKDSVDGDEIESEKSKVLIDEFSKAKEETRRKTFLRVTLTTLGIAGLIWLLYFVSPSINNILFILLFGLLGLSKRLRDEATSRVIESVGLISSAGNIIKGEFLERIFPIASAKLIDPKILQTSFNNTFVGISRFVSDAVRLLRDHASETAQRLEPVDELRTWRLFGYFFQFLFLVTFAYADLVQLISVFGVLFPQSIIQNSLLNNLNLSLLIGTVGAGIAAGFIIGEFAQITNFGKWHEIQPPFAKGVIQFLTWFALIATLVIDLIVALARVTTIEDIAPLMSPETIAQLKLAAALASSAVIVPLFILTFLFLGGIVGIAVVYIIVIRLISFVVQFVQQLFVWIIWILVFSISYIIELIFRTILWILTVLLFVFGWVFAGVGETLVQILRVLLSLLDIIYFPLDALVNWILSYRERNQQKQSQPIK